MSSFTLSDILPLIAAMTYNELKDFIDYSEFYHFSQMLDAKEIKKFLKQTRNRRAGIASGALPYLIEPNNPLQMTTAKQKQALKILKQIEPKELIYLFGDALLMRDSSRSILWILLRTKAPIRKAAKGNIQVKWIPYKRTRLDAEGKPAKDENGIIIVDTILAPYLYLRYNQVHGDNDKRSSRMKSIYIGGKADLLQSKDKDYEYPFRPLANLFYETIQEYGIERTRTDKKTGVIQNYKVRPKGDDNPITALERAILDCIDIEAVDSLGSDAIDYLALEELQNELC